MKKIFLTIMSLAVLYCITSCQKDELDGVNDNAELSKEITETKGNGSRGIYNPDPTIPINPGGYTDMYNYVISTLSNDEFYSERFCFESRDYMSDTVNNDRLYFFESLNKEYYFLCVRISSDYQISESYIVEFTDGMCFDLYIEMGVPIPFDVYTVDDVYAFSAEIDMVNYTYSIVNYNREMVDPDQQTSHFGSILCGMTITTIALPWCTGLMWMGPYGIFASLAIGYIADMVSEYIC